MSDFLGRIGHITEWVVVSNLENRAVNAACDKAQGWWRERKQKKDGSHSSSNSPVPPRPPSQGSQTKYAEPMPQYQQQQQGYNMPPPPPPPPSTGCDQLLITVNDVDGLKQWGPLMVILECNHQRYQTVLGQAQQQFSFPVYQFNYDQVFIWIQSEQQRQTVAHGEIPVRILLNNNTNWFPQQQEQRWIPLRDQYNAPAGQLLINIAYRANQSYAQQMPGPPPPYSYYS